MARVTIRLPAVLAQVVGGERRFEVDGDDLRGALADLARRRPGLGIHLFDEAGALRRHVRCFCNGEFARGDKGLDQRLRDGENITILNSVAGG